MTVGEVHGDGGGRTGERPGEGSGKQRSSFSPLPQRLARWAEREEIAVGAGFRGDRIEHLLGDAFRDQADPPARPGHPLGVGLLGHFGEAVTQVGEGDGESDRRIDDTAPSRTATA